MPMSDADDELYCAELQLIHIDGTPHYLYGEEAIILYLLFSTIMMIFFQIFYMYSCCFCRGCCCGMTTYTRLTCTMVFLFISAGIQARSAVYSMMVWIDPVFYFALIMPIIHFFLHGFGNRDEYASYDGYCQCCGGSGAEPEHQIRLDDVVIIVTPPAQPEVVLNVQPAPRQMPEPPKFLSDPHYEFFKGEVHQLSIAVSGSHFCDARLLENPVMFIVKKWRHHTRIFRADTPESFWKKNVETMTERVREALKLNPEPLGEEPHEAA